MNNKKVIEIKLCNRNFVLLLQGFFVSSAGNAIYQIAVGFWVLATTGSSAKMGLIMACITIPNLIIGPFAGVVADRFNRKYIIVLADLLQGSVVVLLSLFAYMDKLQIWMIVFCGIIMGICSSVFGPTVNSVLPDIVSKDDLKSANSLNGIVTSISTILGNSIGGFLYVAFGAPFMFLLNGISFLLSSLSELFMTIPKVVHEKIQFSFFTDIKEGFSYLRKKKALLKLGVVGSLINFFLFMAVILMISYFDKMEQFDSSTYGYAVTILTIGEILGYVIIGILKIPKHKTCSVYLYFAIILSITRCIPFLYANFIYIATCLFILGFSLSVINTLVSTVFQKSIHQNVRGRVFALFGVLTSALNPLGMAAGGILADHFTIEGIMLVTGLIQSLFFVMLLLDSEVRAFINGKYIIVDAEIKSV